MRFLLDENVSHRVCPYLKTAGHDAVHVADIGLTSTDDQVILDRAVWFCRHEHAAARVRALP